MRSWQLDAFVNFQEMIANGPFVYYQGNGRCDPLRSGYADCSGNEIAAARSVGGDVVCTGSFQIARWCHEAWTGISIDQARVTRGAMLFLDPDNHNEGQGGIPGYNAGHVATSDPILDSNGGLVQSRTVEARNSRAGILFGPFEGRNWDYAAMPPPWWFPSVAEGTSPLPPEVLMKEFVAIKETRSGHGYYCVKRDGAVFCYGDAKYHGGANPPKVAHLDAPISGISVRPSNKGYWLVGEDGAVFSFGDARFHGAAHGLKLAAPITGIAALRNNRGYWLLGADGGIFSYGAAKYRGRPH